KRTHQPGIRFCPYDGEPLIDTAEKDGLIGALLDDKYRLEERVGEGGMGIVYKATHVLMDSVVAIKILNPEMALDQTARERFQREARAAARIGHPNAVTVTDFGLAKNQNLAYLVMEFLEGIELRMKMNREKYLGYQETIVIMQQICSGV